ncbi:MAG: LysR family transcriptional regulator [Clostridia bacterium]|nr:LysR family transcriptional regulator [Clostridia bacterium]
MELTRYRYFLDIAETGSMTKSVERLLIAQPALSQAMKKLEEAMGVPLFVHKGRGIVLTAYGKYLRDTLSPIVAELDEIPSHLATMARLWDETIHVSVNAASSLVTEAIIKYKAKHDNVSFQLLQNAGDDLFDIEITTKEEHEPDEKAYCISENIFIAVPSGGKFDTRTSVSLDEMRQEGFISLMGSRQFRSICDARCKAAGFEPRIIFESDNPAAVKNMIAANLGVGFWPEFTWGAIEHENVRLLAIEGFAWKREVVISHNKNKADNRHVTDFFDFLSAFFEERKAAAQGGIYR